MNTLLHIDSSLNLRRSLTRKLTAEFVAAWRATRTRETVIHRDLARAPVALPGSDLFEAAALARGATPSEAEARALAQANALADELIEAEALVVGAPVTAFSVPAAFKAWLDQVSATGRARRGGPLKGRKALVIATVDAQDREAGRAFHEAYLRHAFAAFGISDLAYVPVIRPAANVPEAEALALEEARVVLRSTLERWNAEEKAALREELAQAAA